jgi:hypothetical protein
MTLHRAVLRTRDYVEPDGTVVPMIKDEVPIGSEYLVDAAVRLPVARCYNTAVGREFALPVVWAACAATGAAGALPSCVLDIDEGPWEPGRTGGVK